jgi:hypothetical protein
MGPNKLTIQWALRVSSLGIKCLEWWLNTDTKLNPRPAAHMGFMVDEVTVGQVSL